MCVCVRKRERESVCVRERKREIVCVCVKECACGDLAVGVSGCVFCVLLSALYDTLCPSLT